MTDPDYPGARENEERIEAERRMSPAERAERARATARAKAMPDDKRALSAEELLDFATCADPDRDRMRDRLLAEHAALKAELAAKHPRFATYFAEIERLRAELAACRRERERDAAEALSSKALDTVMDHRDECKARVAEARAERDAATSRAEFLESELDAREKSRDLWHTRCLAATSRAETAEAERDAYRAKVAALCEAIVGVRSVVDFNQGEYIRMRDWRRVKALAEKLLTERPAEEESE
jgi:hypothetical protein